jgi:hypothetical protein
LRVDLGRGSKKVEDTETRRRAIVLSSLVLSLYLFP